MSDISPESAPTFGSVPDLDSGPCSGAQAASEQEWMSEPSTGQLGTQIPPPSITPGGVGMAVVGLLLYALLFAVLLTRAENVPFLGALFGQLLECIVLGTASLPVWWLTVRRMDGASGVTLTLSHAMIAPIFAWGTLEIYLWLMTSIAGPAITQQITDQYQWVFLSHLTLYIIEFSAFHLVRSIQRLRWRERQAIQYASLARERQLTALKAQINPHFLFNTFNSISATVHAAPEQAREMLADLAALFRYVLDSTDKDLVPLKEEIEFAKLYLDLEAHRFHDRLDVCYDVDIPGEALNVSIPPMVLQPLVENAIKHGISPSEDGGTVAISVSWVSSSRSASLPAKRTDETSEHSVSVKKGVFKTEKPQTEVLQNKTSEEDLLRVEVIDTGVGPDDNFEPGPVGSDTDDGQKSQTGDGGAPSEGVGLSNTNQRLLHIFGPIARLHTEPVSPHGFRVWFHLPRS